MDVESTVNRGWMGKLQTTTLNVPRLKATLDRNLSNLHAFFHSVENVFSRTEKQVKKRPK